jgi:hypothetical protein
MKAAITGREEKVKVRINKIIWDNSEYVNMRSYCMCVYILKPLNNNHS